MRRMIHIFWAVVAFAAISSCDVISNLIHDGDVVARVGKSVLYRSQLADFIPVGTAPEDSANLAAQYINSWAVEQLFMDVADSRLSKSQKDVTKELEDYRRSLIRYRYEQHYINDRLDTLVNHSEIEEYYENHQDMFILEVPVVKARFLNVMKESPSAETMRKKMSSDDYDVLVQLDSLAYKSALRYEDHTEEWMDMVRYARLFGEDYGTLLSRLKPDGYVEVEGEKGDLRIGFVTELVKPGKVAPLGYCEKQIRDIIISNRKHLLLNNLEQDLLKDALVNDKLIIY